MSKPQTIRVMRMNNVRSDGQTNTSIVPLIVKDHRGEEILNDDGSPAVVIDLEPLSDGEHAAIVKEYTNLEKAPNGGRQLYQMVDSIAVQGAILRRTIKGWRGIAGADDKPLVCTDATKVLIDDFVKTQIMRKIFGGEVVEIQAESFR